MKWLIDCHILEYCRMSNDEQDKVIEKSRDEVIKPVYTLPVFEMCRALHLAVKYHKMAPAEFRECWGNFSEAYWGEWLHVSEYPSEKNLAVETWELKKDFGENEKEDVPCENSPDHYWDGHTLLTLRLRTLCQEEPSDKMNCWMANEPDGRRNSSCLSESSSGDLVMDTNNLLDMLNCMPKDGYIRGKIHFPSRLSEKATRWFNRIIESSGGYGKFIVPLSVLEETERISRIKLKYKQARNAIDAICNHPERPLWDLFSFQSLTQDIFDCFQLLYEKLYSPHVKNHISIPSLGDTLVAAHGIYNGCPIASNEWFEKKEWSGLAREFPFLELKDESL